MTQSHLPGPLVNSRQASACCKRTWPLARQTSYLASSLNQEGWSHKGGGVGLGKWLQKAQGTHSSFSVRRKPAENGLFFFLTSYRVKGDLVSSTFTSVEVECRMSETFSHPILSPPPVFGYSKPSQVWQNVKESFRMLAAILLRCSRSRIGKNSFEVWS